MCEYVYVWYTLTHTQIHIHAFNINTSIHTYLYITPYLHSYPHTHIYTYTHTHVPADISLKAIHRNAGGEGLSSLHTYANDKSTLGAQEWFRIAGAVKCNGIFVTVL